MFSNRSFPDGPGYSYNADDDEFDDLAYIDSSAIRSKHRHKNRKKVQSQLDWRTGRSESKDSKKLWNDIYIVLAALLLGKSSRKAGILLFSLALVVNFIIELVSPHVMRYNTIIILALACSVEFSEFPQKTVRPQVIISLSVFLSIGVDVFILVMNRFSLFLTISAILLITLKVLLLNVFYRNSPSASRTRKYMDRRVRLFFIPWFQPRRIMRDVRGRMLAIGWLQLVAVILYLVLSLVVYFYLDAVTFSLFSESSSTLPFYLILKSGSSLLVLLGILYDTDLTLCLWYFGCLGCAVNYVRRHINRKRATLNGWPLSFSFSVVRFYILCFLKMLDFLWGVYGWFLVTRVQFVSIPDVMQVLFVVIGLSLVFSDLWIILLLMGVRWLFKRRRVMKKIGMLEVSDDSEIDEFNLKGDLEEYQHDEEVAEVVNEIHRKLYLLRMKQDAIRSAEATDRSKTQFKGRPKGAQKSVHPSENCATLSVPENPYKRDSRDSSVRIGNEQLDLSNRAILHAVEGNVLEWSSYVLSVTDSWSKWLQRAEGSAPVDDRVQLKAKSKRTGKAIRFQDISEQLPMNDNDQSIVDALSRPSNMIMLSERWTRLQDNATLRLSTVLIDIDAATTLRGQRSTFGGSETDDVLLAFVLEQLVRHVSSKGYHVVETGINEYGAIRLRCWTTTKQGDQSQQLMLLHPQSDDVLVPCLVELKLFPGAAIDGTATGAMRQSFLMEADLRCEEEAGGPMGAQSIELIYRGMALDELFYVID
jgi:hypothetical protein